MPASRKQKTIYMSDNAKNKLLSLDSDASFSIMINRAVKYYYEHKHREAHNSRKLWEKELDKSLTRDAQKEKDRELYKRIIEGE